MSTVTVFYACLIKYHDGSYIGYSLTFSFCDRVKKLSFCHFCPFLYIVCYPYRLLSGGLPSILGRTATYFVSFHTGGDFIMTGDLHLFS